MSNQHEHGGNIFAVARSLGLPPEQVLDFSASINPLGMAPGVRDALVGSLDRLLHYPDKSAQELKERLAAYHGVRSNQVVVANGSTEIIHRLPRIVTGKCALIVAPAFAEYAAALERAGWEIDYLTLQSDDVFRFSLASLEEKLASGVDLLFLCNPANPTGALVPRAEIAEVLRLCGRYGTFLALDEAFMDFCEEDSAKDVVAGGGNAIALRSMTKFFAIPGLRLGYAIGNAAVVAALEEFLEPWSVNTAAQVAGIASLEDESYCEETR